MIFMEIIRLLAIFDYFRKMCDNNYICQTCYAHVSENYVGVGLSQGRLALNYYAYKAGKGK